jgi:hypothetical protein
MFWGISDRFVTARISLLNEVVLKFPRRTHLIHSIGTKTHILGRFEPFRNCTKLDAKLAELAPLTHKFAKRSCVGSFHNEHTRSTPFDPKLMFWGVSDHFVTSRNSMQNWPNWHQ